MRNINLFLFAALTAFAAWVFFQHYRIDGWQNIQVAPRDAAGPREGSAGQGGWASWAPPPRNGQSLRIATFNIQAFGKTKAEKQNVMEVLAQIARQFDVMAIQEVRSEDQDLLPRYVELINATGRHFDYAIGPRLGTEYYREQYAYVFDQETVELDRSQLYTIDDPNNLMHREPFVGWFRARGPAPEQAFTFTLVNMHIDPDRVQAELQLLEQIYRIVRDDGRGEDDVILLGDLNVNAAGLSQLLQGSGMEFVLKDGPTNTRGSGQYDNILFYQRATEEYLGRHGVLDFVRGFNLSIDQALEVSDHLPVWAEFSRVEGGDKGRVATAIDTLVSPPTLQR